MASLHSFCCIRIIFLKNTDEELDEIFRMCYNQSEDFVNRLRKMFCELMVNENTSKRQCFHDELNFTFDMWKSI